MALPSLALAVSHMARSWLGHGYFRVALARAIQAPPRGPYCGLGSLGAGMSGLTRPQFFSLEPQPPQLWGAKSGPVLLCPFQQKGLPFAAQEVLAVSLCTSPTGYGPVPAHWGGEGPAYALTRTLLHPAGSGSPQAPTALSPLCASRGLALALGINQVCLGL